MNDGYDCLHGATRVEIRSLSAFVNIAKVDEGVCASLQRPLKGEIYVLRPLVVKT